MSYAPDSHLCNSGLSGYVTPCCMVFIGKGAFFNHTANAQDVTGRQYRMHAKSGVMMVLCSVGSMFLTLAG